VMVAVVPAPEHPVIMLVTQLVSVIVATELLVPPGMNDVERETV
jgi:hypothetical protein